jgi:hypothetical protein
MSDLNNSLAALDDALRGGTRWAIDKNTPTGTEVGGRIVRAEVKQCRNFDTGEPETWDDGNPQTEIVVTVQTALREDENDNGQRAFHMKTWGEQSRALREALKAAGAASPSEGLRPGNGFYGKRTGSQPVPGKRYSMNLWAFRIVQNAPSSLDDALGGGDAAERPDPAPKARVHREPEQTTADYSGADQLDPAVATKVEKMLDAEVPVANIAAALGITEAQVAEVERSRPPF